MSPEVSAVLAAGIGSFRRPSAKLARALRVAGCYDIPDEVIVHLRTRKPHIDAEQWRLIQQAAEDVVIATRPQLPYAAGLLHTTVATYLAWATQSMRQDFDSPMLWSRQLINMYVTNSHLDLAEGTRRNYRSILNRVSRILAPEDHAFEYTPLSRKDSAAPYSAAEMLMYRQWASGQANPRYRRRSILMLSLIAGAGLGSGEVGLITPEHCDVSKAGILISVPGTKARIVPLLATWDDWLLAMLESATPGQPLWGAPDHLNRTTLVSSLVENAQGRGPNSRRLQSTWIVWHLNNRTPMREFFAASGVQKKENLGRYLKYCDPLDPEAYLSVLRGKARS